jgi:tetrahydromethanopterin S-methyltransferase subunit G
MSERGPYIALAFSVLINVVLVAGVIAMAAHASSSGAVTRRLHLATPAQVKDVESLANDLGFRTAELESAIGDTSGFDDLGSRIDDLEVRLDDLETGSGDEANESVNDVGYRVDDVESRLDDIESTVGYGLSIDDLSSRLEDVESRVDDLCLEVSFELNVYC